VGAPSRSAGQVALDTEPPPPPPRYDPRCHAGPSDQTACTVHSTDLLGCVHVVGESVLTAWLSISCLQSDSLLALHNLDWYGAHTALRHVHALPPSQHIVFVALPIYLQKRPAFTPYSKDGRTVSAKESTFVAYATSLPEHTFVLASDQIKRRRCMVCGMFTQRICGCGQAICGIGMEAHAGHGMWKQYTRRVAGYF
jgi:hypothetical protein